MSQAQPIDTVKKAVESILPVAYMVGITLVYAASAVVMSFLLFPSFLKIIANPTGSTIAAVSICTAIQFMRFLIVFTDSLTAGRNDSVFIVRLTSFCMLLLGIVEVFSAVKAVGGSMVISVSCSSLMLAGCILELLFVAKLNKRDLELEAEAKKTGGQQQASSNGQASHSRQYTGNV